MADGNVTFRGNSTITRTRAVVRPALPHAHAGVAHAHTIQRTGTTMLAEALAAHTTLRTLSLDENGIGADGTLQHAVLQRATCNRQQATCNV